MFCRFRIAGSISSFRNFFIKPGKKENLEYSIFKARVQNRGGQIHVVPQRADVLVNDEAVPKSGTPLSENDRVTVRFKGKQVVWIYQTDLKAIKNADLEEAKAAGIERTPPSLDSKWLSKNFTINQDGFGIKSGLGFKQFAWNDVDEVVISRQEGQGGLVGLVVEAAITSQRGKVIGSTVYDQLFQKGEFMMTLRNAENNGWKGYLMNTAGIVASDCVEIAHAMDYYAPVDLLNLIHLEIINKDIP